MSWICEDCEREVPVIYYDRVCELELCGRCSDKHDKQHQEEQ